MNIEIICYECGEDISGKYEISIDRLRIDPCEKCLKREYDQGYDQACEDKEEKED